jgi:hypothetical protein
MLELDELERIAQASSLAAAQRAQRAQGQGLLSQPQPQSATSALERKELALRDAEARIEFLESVVEDADHTHQRLAEEISRIGELESKAAADRAKLARMLQESRIRCDQLAQECEEARRVSRFTQSEAESEVRELSEELDEMRRFAVDCVNFSRALKSCRRQVANLRSERQLLRGRLEHLEQGHAKQWWGMFQGTIAWLLVSAALSPVDAVALSLPLVTFVVTSGFTGLSHDSPAPWIAGGMVFAAQRTSSRWNGLLLLLSGAVLSVALTVSLRRRRKRRSKALVEEGQGDDEEGQEEEEEEEEED